MATSTCWVVLQADDAPLASTTTPEDQLMLDVDGWVVPVTMPSLALSDALLDAFVELTPPEQQLVRAACRLLAQLTNVPGMCS
jgi:hypothetical protein